MAVVDTKGLEIWACEWGDAHCNNNDLARDEVNYDPVNYVTSGILLNNDERGVTLASDICETATFRGINSIPRGMVLRVWRIGKLEHKPRTKAASAPEAVV